MRCPKCGAVVQDGARFCGRCRHEMQPEVQNVARNAPSQGIPVSQPVNRRPQGNPVPLRPRPNQTQPAPTYVSAPPVAMRQGIPRAVYVAVSSILMVAVTVLPWIDPTAGMGSALGVSGISGWNSLPVLGFGTLFEAFRMLMAGYGVIEAYGMGLFLGVSVFGFVCAALWVMSMFFLIKSVMDDVRGRDGNRSAFIGALGVAASAAIVIVAEVMLMSIARSSLGAFGGSLLSPFALITIWCWISAVLGMGGAIFRKVCPAPTYPAVTTGMPHTY